MYTLKNGLLVLEPGDQRPANGVWAEYKVTPKSHLAWKAKLARDKERESHKLGQEGRQLVANQAVERLEYHELVTNRATNVVKQAKLVTNCAECRRRDRRIAELEAAVAECLAFNGRTWGRIKKMRDILEKVSH